MAYIYKITNDINDKIYIGKTELTIQKRFKQHCIDRLKRVEEKRPLYNAMNKYGIEHFFIEEIEKCDSIEASEKEKYWINFYNSYKTGYNATIGGEGALIYDHDLILKELLNNPYPCEVAKKIGCGVDIVYNIAKQNNIRVKNKSQEQIKAVLQYDKNNEFIQEFASIKEAGEWCFNNTNTMTKISSYHSHISDVCKGKRKTAYGYIWKYKNTD